MFIEGNTKQQQIFYCPFDSTHLMPKDSFIKHIDKCKSRYKKLFKQCPYNVYHFVKLNQYEKHCEYCGKGMNNKNGYDSMWRQDEIINQRKSSNDMNDTNRRKNYIESTSNQIIEQKQNLLNKQQINNISKTNLINNPQYVYSSYFDIKSHNISQEQKKYKDKQQQKQKQQKQLQFTCKDCLQKKDWKHFPQYMRINKHDSFYPPQYYPPPYYPIPNYYYPINHIPTQNLIHPSPIYYPYPYPYSYEMNQYPQQKFHQQNLINKDKLTSQDNLKKQSS